jgi:PAP2 superfamily C-terminal
MKKIIAKHKAVWSRNDYIVSTLLGLLFLFTSLVINFFAGRYADFSASNKVTDIILDHLPVVNVELLFIDGFGVFLLFVLLLILLEPKRLPFLLKSLAVLIGIRSFFIILTHLAPSTDISALEFGKIGSKLTFSGDLFFSAHTGIPFLFALIFWQHKILRWIFAGFSVFFAAVVLLGHLHYSIDVFAAYFITFTIYSIAKKIFPDDFKRFNEAVVA